MAETAQSNDVVVEAAEAIADGTRPDWVRLYAGATGRASELLDALQHVADMITPSQNVPEAPLPSEPLADDSDAVAASTFLELGDHIGGGAFADVYAGKDLRLQRDVALKMLRRGTSTSADAVEALREARLLARIHHPNVVTVYSAEPVDGRVAICMELVRGRTLSAIVRDDGPRPEKEAIEIGVQVCRALQAVHGAGLLHRDVKAHNVIRESAGRVVLMDLGTGRDVAPQRTVLSDLAGTPMYLAPELFSGARATVRSDIYSLGVLLFYLLTGHFPVEAASLGDLVAVHVNGPASKERLPLSGVSEGMRHVLQRALAPSPDRRFATVGEMERALADLPTMRWTAAAASLSSLCTVVLLLLTLVRNAVSSPAAATNAQVPLLVGGFANHTGQAAFEGAVETLLKRQLPRSRAIFVVPEERVQDALALMKLPEHHALNFEAAREVAERDGLIPAYIAGSIAPGPGGYTIHARLGFGQRSRQERTLFENFVDVGDLGRTAARLSESIRQVLGESARDIRTTAEPPPRVTTTSIAALRLYDRALAAAARAQPDVALQLALEAVGQDPAFAAGHTLIAMLYMSRGEAAAARRVIDDALPLAASASERERLMLLALDREIRGDTQKALTFYQMLLQLEPGNYWTIKRVIALDGAADPAAAVALLKAASDARPSNYGANVDTALGLMALGEVRDAVRYAERARSIEHTEHLPQSPWLTLLPAFERWLAGSPGDAARIIDTATTGNQISPALLTHAAQFDLALGRLSAARDLLERAPQNAIVRPLLAVAEWQAGGGKVTSPVIPASGMVPLLETWVWVLTATGRLQEAAELVDLRRRQLPPGAPGLEVVEGMLLTAQRRFDESVPKLRSWKRMPIGTFAVAGAEQLAGALQSTGDTAEACATLADATRLPAAAYGNNATLLMWVRARVALVECNAALGNAASVRQLTNQLRPLLALADPDFEPAQRLARY